MKSLYNDVNSELMLKYGTTKILPRHMNSILVVAWDSIKVSERKLIRNSFAKTKQTPLRTPDLTTNTQECSTSVQVTSVTKSGKTNEISLRTVAPIEVEEIRTDDPMVVLQEKGSQQPSGNIFLRDAACEAVMK